MVTADSMIKLLTYPKRVVIGLKMLSTTTGRALGLSVATSSRRLQRSRRFIPKIEYLQERLAPAGLAGGILYIDGTNDNDLVIVARETDYIRVIENGQNQYFPLSSIGNQVVFRGYDGNDRFVNSTGLLATAYGMNGADVLIGGGNSDILFGGDGNDTLFGGDGDDHLAGENGSDMLYGERGHDRIVGAFFGWAGEFEGHDLLDGGDGNDGLWGGDGNDLIIGGNGADLLAGENGADRLFGAFYGWAAEFEGHDHLYGGDGNDELWGGDGNDLIVGENGSDLLYGEWGHDKLIGAFVGWDGEFEGHDKLYGGDGHDELWAGYGNDQLAGDNGEDYLNGGWGSDVMDGGADNDWLDGGMGNDQLYGGWGNDILHGDDGHDSVLGQGGHDFVYGEAGNDLLDGGEGDDYVYGGDNDDKCFGGNGRDHVYGDAGDDFLAGGHLNFSATSPATRGDPHDWNYDFLHGGAGHDIFMVSDQKMLGWWLDSVRDKTSEDEVIEYGLGGLNHPKIPFYWGHLYGTQP